MDDHAYFRDNSKGSKQPCHEGKPLKQEAKTIGLFGKCEKAGTRNTLRRVAIPGTGVPNIGIRRQKIPHKPEKKASTDEGNGHPPREPSQRVGIDVIFRHVSSRTKVG